MTDLGPYSLDTIVVGDCLDVMRAMPDGCVDFGFADPPYWVGFDYSGTKDTDMQYVLPHDIIAELVRVSKTVCVTPGIGNLWDYPRADWVLCWWKTGSCRRVSVGFNHWEPVLCYKPPKLQASDYQPDVIRAPMVYIEKLDHPCPKPLSLLSHLVGRFSGRGDLIFDPFMGSGTTAVAAKKLGRHYFGCDISEEYVKMARERVAKIDGVQMPLSYTEMED